MNALRLFFIGGLTSYRALFSWLSPWILVPTFILGPIFQILFFAYVGRAAGAEDDAFFVIGNAVQYAAIPCLFAMGNTISGERQQATLPLLLASPAARIPLFLGRALPVIVNGLVVSVVALFAGAVLLGVHLRPESAVPLTLVVAVSAFACTGLGLTNAALALRVRETAVLPNILFGILLIFAGVNVRLSALPPWMAAVAHWLPLTHGIDAARRVAAGATLGEVRGDLYAEAGLGLLFAAAGLAMLAWFERESRRHATLDVA
ncbi:ABC transporter permease [Dactylosporangium sp. NPDC051484]|uniref:ABC transporter permease n=1 Tax=Dactylosporangium sp. NPDC051484 TaxID=3154942 RepID=UPI00344C7F06